jgi:phage recombination protein Bet
MSTANIVPLPTTGQRYSRDQIELVKRTLMPRGSTDDELALFLGTAERLGLDPFTQQIRAIRRQEWNADTRRMEPRISIEVGIDGLRANAHRTGEVRKQLGPYWCGPDGKWVDAWLKEQPPSAAKFGVLREGYLEPRWGVALWLEYRQTKQDGSTTKMWTDRPAGQLAKCAEALAWRAAFPHELGGIYTTDEMAQADHDEAATISRFAVVEGGIPSEETIRGLESVAAAKELVTREIVSDRFREAVKIAQVEAFGEVWEDFWRHANLASWLTVLLDAWRAVQPRAIETSGPVASPPGSAGPDPTSEGEVAGEREPGSRRNRTGGVQPSPSGDQSPATPSTAATTPTVRREAGAQTPASTTPEAGAPTGSGANVPGSDSSVRGRQSKPRQLRGAAAGREPTDEAEQAAFDQQLAQADEGARKWTR